MTTQSRKLAKKFTASAVCRHLRRQPSALHLEQGSDPCRSETASLGRDLGFVTMKLEGIGYRKCQRERLLAISAVQPLVAIMHSDKSFATYWLPRHLISMRLSKRDAMLRSRPSFGAEDGAGSGRRWQANRDGLMLLMSSLLPSHQHAAGFPLRGIMGAC